MSPELETPTGTRVSEGRDDSRAKAPVKLRVLQSVPTYYPAFVYGGPTFSTHFASDALARLGVDIRVATTNANGTTRLDVPTDHGVPFGPNYMVRYYEETIVGRFSWAFARNVWREVRESDVVHLHDIYSPHAILTMAASLRYGKPLLVSPRGSLSMWARTAKRSGAKALWLKLVFLPLMRDRRRVAWHATSAAEREETLVVDPGSRVFVVPNGMDCGEYERRPRLDRVAYLARFMPSRGERPVGRVFAGLGRLHEKKSFDVAIRALSLLGPAHADDVLLIAGGDDGARAGLERLVGELGLQDRVVFVGEVRGDDKIDFLKGADLFLFPTFNENFGMSCLEALAAGLPVVSSREAPWEEVETAGAGRFVDNTPEAFVAAIRDVLSRDPGILGANARAIAAKYDLAAIAADFVAIYTTLLSTGADHGR